MRISDLLQSMASWLENPNNDIFLSAEKNDDCLAVVASYCVEAAEILKKASQEVDKLEPKESLLTPEGIESLAELANSLDSSGDKELMKQASLIDELLISISAPERAVASKLAKDEEKIKELSDKYYNLNNNLHDVNKTADIAKDLEEVTKNYKNLEAPLSTRDCPDHAGVQLFRVGDNVWKCEMDKKEYDFGSGFTLMNGDHVPGGDVSYQTDYFIQNEFAQFDTREGRLNSNKV